MEPDAGGDGYDATQRAEAPGGVSGSVEPDADRSESSDRDEPSGREDDDGTQILQGGAATAGQSSEDDEGEDDGTQILQGGPGTADPSSGDEESGGANEDSQEESFDTEQIAELSGTVIDDRYLVEEEIEKGGMGVVFKGQHQTLDRDVVIKVIRPEEVKSETARARFEREARRACQLEHPNVVTVHDFGYHDELGYLVMEFVDGITVSDYLDEQGPMSFPQFAPVLASILKGLEEAHRHDVVHRDIKCANIMLTFDGEDLRRVKILDFGLAKVEDSEEDDLTKQSDLIGTIGAMPPERIMGNESDERVDLYATGIAAYRMITGERPFTGEDMQVLYEHVHEHPPTLTETLPDDHEFPLSVLQYLHRLLAKEPDDRPDDASEALEWLYETVETRGIFRLDEQEFPWLAQDGSSGSSTNVAMNHPEWIAPEPPEDSYPSLHLFDDSGVEQQVEQLRDGSEVAPDEEAASAGDSWNARAWLVAAGVLLVLGVAGGFAVMLLSNDADSEANAAEAAATSPSNDDQKKSAQSDKERVQVVFQKIESALAEGNYGTAQSLLSSIDESVQKKPDYQVKAAEYRTQIKVGRKLREAEQAEHKLHIEKAVNLYDEVLSLAANHKKAKARYDELIASIALKVTAEPVADVYVDGNRLGQTPIEQMVSADVTKVSVRRPGYETWEKPVSAEGGTRVEYAAELDKVSAGGSPDPEPSSGSAGSEGGGGTDNNEDDEDDSGGGLMPME